MGEDEGQTNPGNNYLNGVIKGFFCFFLLQRGECQVLSSFGLSFVDVLASYAICDSDNKHTKDVKTTSCRTLSGETSSRWVYTLLFFSLLKVDLSLFL